MLCYSSGTTGGGASGRGTVVRGNGNRLPVVEIDRLGKSYGKVRALSGLTLTIRPGRVVGILGRNGAGKSTLIGLIAGQLRPTEGSIEVFGAAPPFDADVRRRLGYAPQRLAIYDALTLIENLEVFASAYGLRGQALRDAVWRALDRVDLTSVAGRRAGHCSGGMRRRLNIAAALLHRAELVLLDEPTAGVDIESRERILELVRELAGAGTTVLYATHYIEETEMVCDDVLVIDGGRALAYDTPAALVATHAGGSLLRYRAADGAKVEMRLEHPHRYLAEILARGEEIADVEIRPPRMEDAFRAILKGGTRS